MGYNTVLMVLNDAFDQIQKDPDFGRNLVNAAVRHDPTRQKINTFSSGNHCNPAQIISVQHADISQLTLVSRNSGTCIYPNSSYALLKPDRSDMQELVNILNALGFSVTWPDGKRSSRSRWEGTHWKE